MRNCFVPGCDRHHRDRPKRMMFVAPKDKTMYNAWVEALPQVRPFRPQDRVCEYHFNKEDIRTTYDNMINGLIYRIERGRPRLSLKAVPCRNLVPYVNSPRPKNSRKPAKPKQPNKETRSEPVATSLKKTTDLVEQEEHLEIEEVQDVQEITPTECSSTPVEAENTTSMEVEQLERIDISPISELYESLYDDIYEVVLPNTLWGVHRCPERSAVYFSYIDVTLHRTSKVVSVTSLGGIKIILGNQVVSEYNLVEDVNSIESLSNLIGQVDEMRLCSGIFSCSFCELTAKDESTTCAVCSELDQSNE